MGKIRIDVGVYTAFTFDCSDFDFKDVKMLVLTVKNKADIHSEVIIEREFKEPKIHNVIISPQESVLLESTAQYDIDKILTDGKRFKITENEKIQLRKCVGDAID